MQALSLPLSIKVLPIATILHWQRSKGSKQPQRSISMANSLAHASLSWI